MKHHTARVGGCALLLLSCAVFLTACGTPPVEETVTLDASRLSALPARTEPVAVMPKLPARDEPVETAGDRIAAAITSLGKRGVTRAQRSSGALRSLEQAQAALARALNEQMRGGSGREALSAAARDLSAATKLIERGALPEAVAALNALDKKLDRLSDQAGTDDSR